jgi:poly(hydroxyalkanoate) depolymerase family esterase
MHKLLQRLLAAWRWLWLTGLGLLRGTWRWLARLLGVPPEQPPAAPPPGRPSRGEKPGRPATAPPGPADGPAADGGTEPRPAAREAPAGGAVGTLASAPAPVPAPAPWPAAAPAIERATASPPTAGLAPRKAAAAKPGQFSGGVFRNDAGQRDYKLYVPAAKPDAPLPLLVMLHGCKQDPDDFAAGTRMNEWADRQPMLVLYPAQTRAANPYACWNWFNRHDQQRDGGEPHIIAGMILDVAARHGADPRRIYAAGLSAGGAMTAILAHTHPELLAAAGVHSGLPHGAAQTMIGALGVMKRGGPARRASRARAKPSDRRGVPLIVFHGDHDKTVHPINGEHLVQQALESARAAKPHDLGRPIVKPGRVPAGHAYTRTAYADRAGQVQVEHWVVQGSGHAWSGGDSAGSFTDPLGPDASAEMLRFFLERTRA